MKKIIYSLLILLITISCTESNEDKAKKLIRNDLKLSLHDEKSYESVSFGSLDSVFTDFSDDLLILNYFLKYESFKDIVEKGIKDMEIYKGMISPGYKVRFNIAKKESTEGLDSMKFYAAKMDSLKMIFVPEFKGWSMNHSYRANNSSGNKIIEHYRYNFNKELTRVSSSKDISR